MEAIGKRPFGGISSGEGLCARGGGGRAEVGLGDGGPLAAGPPAQRGMEDTVGGDYDRGRWTWRGSPVTNKAAGRMAEGLKKGGCASEMQKGRRRPSTGSAVALCRKQWHRRSGGGLLGPGRVEEAAGPALDLPEGRSDGPGAQSVWLCQGIHWYL